MPFAVLQGAINAGQYIGYLPLRRATVLTQASRGPIMAISIKGEKRGHLK
jgi:hypothetical protein